MFRQLFQQLANEVIVPKLAKSKPFVAAAQKAHALVQKVKSVQADADVKNLFGDAKADDGKEATPDPTAERTPGFTMERLQAMKVPQLKQEITTLGLPLPENAFEKSEFVDVLLPFVREETADERAEASVAEMQKSVADLKESLFSPFAELREHLKAEEDASKSSFQEKASSKEEESTVKADFTAAQLHKMKVPELKKEITNLALPMPENAIDKFDFVEVLLPFARAPTADDEAEASLAEIQKSVEDMKNDFFRPFAQLKSDAQADMKALKEKFKS